MFKIKLKENDRFKKYKANLVAKDYKQENNVNYEKVRSFSSSYKK